MGKDERGFLSGFLLVLERADSGIFRVRSIGGVIEILKDLIVEFYSYRMKIQDI